MLRLVLCVVLVLTNCPSVWTLDCVQIDQCSCGFDDGSGTVDLSKLGRSDGTPLIQDAFAADNYAYSYNPCYPFDEGTCKNAAACQYDSANVVWYNIGDSSKVVINYDGLNVIATYTADDGQRSSKVTLVCDPSATTPTTVANGETGTATYEFTVTTSDACPSGSSPSFIITVNASISAGSVLVIVFFALIVVYFIAGTVFMKFGKHRSGREVVPNVAFWTALPGLVKDGFGFVVGKTCRRGGYKGI